MQEEAGSGLDTGKLCHALSKDARKEIIEVLHSKYRSMRELARELGVTTPAVAKYLRGKTHPKDEVMCRALELAFKDDYTGREVKSIIFADIVGTMEVFFIWMLDKGLLSVKDLDRLASRIGRYKLALIGAPSPRA